MKLLSQCLLGLLLVAGLLYVGDWAVWKVKMAHGTGMGQMTVGRLQVAALKGNKEEYFPDGNEEVECSRSLFPQAGDEACWWLARHRVIFER